MERNAGVAWLGLVAAVMALGLGLAALILALDDDGPAFPVVAGPSVRVAPERADGTPDGPPQPAPARPRDQDEPDRVLPDLGAAPLGVQVDPSEEGLRVTAVLPGSAAEAAGVEVGDVISAIDGDAIQSVAEARAALAAHAPDALLDLEVIRDGEREVLRVALPTVTVPRLDALPFDPAGPFRAFAGPLEVRVRQGTVAAVDGSTLTLETARGAVTFDLTEETVLLPRGHTPAAGETAFVLASGDAAIVVWVASAVGGMA